MLTPDNFESDPWGYVGNQSGHARIGAGAALVGLVFWDETGAMLMSMIVAAYFVVVEWRWQGLSLFWDSVDDASHVGFGAGGVVALHHQGPLVALGVFLAWFAVIIVGIVRRT